MEFADVVRRRRMVRDYTAEAVDPDVVERMLAHANRAPSAGNSAGWAFLVLDSPADVGRFWTATTPPLRLGSRWLEGMSRAPVVIVPLACERIYRERYARPDKRGSDQDFAIPYWQLDTAMAALLILQSAVDEGLGGCFFGIPSDRVEALRIGFGVPDDHEPIGAITIGHPAPDRTAPARERRPLTEVVHRGRW